MTLFDTTFWPFQPVCDARLGKLDVVLVSTGLNGGALHSPSGMTRGSTCNNPSDQLIQDLTQIINCLYFLVSDSN